RTVDEAALEQAVRRRVQAGDRRSFLEALRRPGLSLIAEHKRRSPSAGAIREDAALEEVVGAYERAGACALSILTEPHSFGGSLEDLRRARERTSLPILRKDFIIDPYQVTEAFAGGADAVLLIVAALPERQLADLQAQALDLGLPALVEVHDRGELEVALATGAALIGINNRDLTTLRVDTGRTQDLLAEIPCGTTVVAESGFSAPEQLDQLEQAGVDAVLIGEALMRAVDIEAACRALTARR
ncbi:MAG: indole-3-glycerol phosphate synthase TrpC, partial [Actinomycetota bacterium]|nr:indole-3-glycerol phosphate synthase TrpC [Actinomycetota bacterium]